MLTRWCSPGCDSIAHNAGTWTEPGSHTRPRSLRARSTIITFSAWSFALSRNAAAVAAVPLIGRVSTSRCRRRRYRSGDADTTAVPAPSSGSCSSVRCGRGVRGRERAVQRDGIDGVVACESAREVDLVALAHAQHLEHRADAVGVLVAIEPAAPPCRREGRARRDRQARRTGRGRFVEQRGVLDLSRAPDTAPRVDDRQRVEAREDQVGHARGFDRSAPCHHPLGRVPELDACRSPRDALGARFDYEEARVQTLPMKFACPSIVLRDGSTNSGATEVFQPWSEAVAEG